MKSVTYCEVPFINWTAVILYGRRKGHMRSHGGGREPKMKHVMSKQFILRYEEIISVRLEV